MVNEGLEQVGPKEMYNECFCRSGNEQVRRYNIFLTTMLSRKAFFVPLFMVITYIIIIHERYKDVQPDSQSKLY
jgi:hypothetical protein